MRAVANSLRGRLLRLLVLPLLLVLLASAVFDYRIALQHATHEQDLALARVAIALATRLDVDADDAANDDLAAHLMRTMVVMQRGQTQDRLWFLVRHRDGPVVAGDVRLLALIDAQAATQPVYEDGQLAGVELRVVTYPHASQLGPLIVVVAESTGRRRAQAREVLMDTAMPNVILVALTLALVWAGVRLALRPLEVLGQQVEGRRTDDLSPLRLKSARELRPLVDALNRLMHHLRGSASSQQQFISNAAHQLRTPLAGLQTQIELLGQELPPMAGQRLAAMSQAVQRLSHSAHQMLTLARSGEDAVGEDQMAAVDLRPLLEDAASDWIDAALAAGVELEFDLAPAEVRGSQWLLRELVNNVLHNAIKHSPRGARIQLACGFGGVLGSGAWLLIEDEGPGIAADERARVFERFYRVPNAHADGSGLGLAIVGEAALRHGARVELSEGRDGRGLKVTVRFPPVAADGVPTLG